MHRTVSQAILTIVSKLFDAGSARILNEVCNEALHVVPADFGFFFKILA